MTSKEQVIETDPCDPHIYHKPKPQVNKVNKQSWDYVIRSGICGGFAGTSAKTLIAPLDRVKILFQTSNPEFRKYTGSWLGFWRAGRHIFSTSGFIALYQGHSATLLRIFPYASIKFVSYEQIRALLIKNKQQETAGRRLAAGSICGVISVFCVYPLDLIRVRLAYDTKSGNHKGLLVKTVKTIYKEGNKSGMSNFYRGFVPTIWGMIPYAGVSFWAHDVFHDIFRSKFFRKYSVLDKVDINEKTKARKPLAAWAQLIAGGMSGLAGQTASYPFEVVRRRMQVAGATGLKTGMWSTAKNILQTQGIQGLFIGLSIGYIKVVPMFACSFFVYERLKLTFGI